MNNTNFMNEAKRMCSSFDCCDECPAYDGRLLSCKICFCDECSEKEKISIVEKWSEEHPAKTRQSMFLEQWPEAEIDESGCLMLCPLTVSADKRNEHEDCTTLKCTDCRRQFWMQEVE